MREWLPAQAYDRPVSVLMVFIALMVVGAIAWSRIPLQMMPSGFEPRFMWIGIPWQDASPAEADEQIVRPVEAQLGTVPGIRDLTSSASSGRASFSVRFFASADMDDVYNSVIDRIERAMPDLPDDIERYWVYKYNPSDQPVMWVGVTLPEDVEDPYHLMTRVVQPRLERVSGVAAIDVWGTRQRVAQIDYDAERLFAHGIDLGDLHTRLSRDNFQMSGGRVVDRGRVQYVRSLARLERVEQLARYPVKGALVLEDVADVRAGAVRSLTIHRVAGKEAAGLAIRKESTANTVQVCADLVAVLHQLEADPRTQGASFFVFFDQGELIADSLKTLLLTAFTGGILAVLILYAFLREWRMTLLIAASIPFSLLITVAVLYFRGGTLNLIALMGLMLAVGMVVDNAIVVVETIYRRRAEGAGVREAAVQGTAEVNLAIVLSTATTMVVFLPIILMSEDAMVSFFMRELGLPVIFALAASLIVALVFAPLATRYIGAAEVRPDPAWLAALSRGYLRALRWVLAYRADTVMLLLALALLTGGVAVRGVKCTDEASGNLNNFVVRFDVPPQADFARRDAIVKAYEQMVEDHREAWGVRVYRSRLRDKQLGGRLYVYLNRDGPLARDEVIDAAREALPDLAGVKATIGWEGGMGGAGGNTLTLAIHGEDTSTLRALAEEVARRARGVEGVMAAHLDVENDGADEVVLRLDREALVRYGIAAARVGNTLAYAMRGSALQPLFDGEHEIPVSARFSLEDREDLERLMDFKFWSQATQQQVPLRALAHVSYGKGPHTITRHNRETSTTVTLDLEQDFGLDDALVGVSAALEDMVLPRGYRWSKGERFQRDQEDDAALKLAMLLSVTFVFLLMGVLFESWILPLSILTAIPMALGGAWWGLYLTGTEMDTMAGIGLVILVGVVVNNGIVLVDYVTQLRAEGVPRREALLRAGERRLRPILMTALTTVCGLIPMAVGSSGIIGIPYAPLGRTVIGGLAAGTVLTLLFVPFLYALLDDLRDAWLAGLGFVRWRRS